MMSNANDVGESTNDEDECSGGPSIGASWKRFEILTFEIVVNDMGPL